MKKSLSILLVICLALSVMAVGCTTETKASGTYSFDDDMEGWIGGFADLPSDKKLWDTFEIEIEHDKIPIKGKDDSGIRLSSSNRSDDLFLYIYRELTGLEPNTEYDVNMKFDIATNAPSGGPGAGGSPGDSVYVKAGVVDKQPDVVEDKNDYLRLNLDKGNQSQGGKDLKLLGTMAKENSDDDSYEYKKFDLKTSVKTDSDGRVWLIIGTDSGYEGKQTYYINNVTVDFTKK